MNISNSDLEIVNHHKRPVQFAEWSDKKRKILKDSGKSYKANRGKGNVVPKKVLPSNPRGCSAACEKRGRINLSLAYVHSLFHQLYGLTYNEQSLLLLKFISLRKPWKRRTGKSDSTFPHQDDKLFLIIPCMGN